MRIVILDADTVSRNDISLEPICSLGETEIYGFTPNEKVAEVIGSADAVICNKALITDEVFEKCPNLKYVGLFATGYNNIDVASAKRHGVVVCNVPEYSTNAVAQHVFALMLNHFNRISDYAKSVEDGEWVRSKLFSYFYIPIYELAGQNLGIIGYGAIGKAVAKIAQAFGMNVLVYSRTAPKDTDKITVCTLEELLKNSDVVTLHCPLNDGTKELINAKTLSMMKKSALLINTSRGGTVNEQDLCNALNNGVIAGASLDVITIEPMTADCPLRNAKNLTVTPHIAWAPKQTRIRLIDGVAENLKAFINGSPQNNVV